MQAVKETRDIPERMERAINEYVESGRNPGDFLYYVLSNDLVGAFGAADAENREAMQEYAYILYNDLPGNCWGNTETVDSWIESGGIEGQNAE